MKLHQHDFRYMHQGKHLKALTIEDTAYLKELKKINSPRHDTALLLLHGFSSSPAVYRALVPRLPNYDAIIVPTLPGHAENIQAFGEVSADKWLIAAEKICHELTHSYQRVDVMGLSLGGLIACHLSQVFSLHHLYLLAPALSLRLNTTITSIGIHLLKRLGFTAVRNFAGNIHRNEYSELAYRQLPLSTILTLMDLIKNFDFRSPACDTDLFLGAYDNVVHSDEVAKLFAGLPNVKTHWLKNSAHALPLDGDLSTIAACVNAHYQAVLTQAEGCSLHSSQSMLR